VHISRTKALPIRGVDDPLARRAVCAEVEALLELHAARRSAEGSAELEPRIEAVQARLDALVLDIYEVGGDDRAAIQAWEERA